MLYKYLSFDAPNNPERQVLPSRFYYSYISVRETEAEKNGVTCPASKGLRMGLNSVFLTAGVALYLLCHLAVL